MPRLISRRKLADYIADEIKAGNDSVIKQVAAYLIETNQERIVSLLVRDVELALASRGVMIADVTTATKLSSELKSAIATLLDTKELHLREEVDPSVLGGVRIETAQHHLDATMRHKLQKLKTISAKKGTK